MFRAPQRYAARLITVRELFVPHLLCHVVAENLAFIRDMLIAVDTNEKFCARFLDIAFSTGNPSA
jgi:hypothetical protein